MLSHQIPWKQQIPPDSIILLQTALPTQFWNSVAGYFLVPHDITMRSVCTCANCLGESCTRASPAGKQLRSKNAPSLDCISTPHCWPLSGSPFLPRKPALERLNIPTQQLLSIHLCCRSYYHSCYDQHTTANSQEKIETLYHHPFDPASHSST